jgi:HAD superfamily hydrolase (TIGR01549 family)
MKYWIFDLDGTLVDSFGSYFNTVEKIMNKKMTTEERKVCVSLHPSELFAMNLSTERAKEAMLELRRIGATDAINVEKFSAIENLLIHLKERGCNISIFTSRDIVSAKITIEAMGLNKYIDHLVSGDCVSEKKPSPEGLHKLQKLYDCDFSQMVMIGDHECDMLAGTSVGVFSVRASWHKHWDHEACALADKQFLCDQDFFQWIKTI